MATYPSSLWSGNTRGTNLSDAEVHTTWHDDAMDEIIAVQTELGTAPSAAFATVKARLTDIDSSITALETDVAEFDSTSANFTPTWTNLTVGNGTVTAKEARIGPLVINTIRLVFGSTTGVTGSVIFSCSEAALSIAPTFGTVELLDFSTSTTYQGFPERSSTTAVFLRTMNVASTYPTLAAVNATVPFTWTTSDQMTIAIGYFAA